MIHRARRTLLAALLTAVASVGAGCATDEVSPATGDCSAQVRVDGVVYTSYGYTDRPATQLAWADEAACDDMGPEPVGSVFPENPERVRTWQFAGYSPAEVVGVRHAGSESLAVFVADSVAPVARDRIYAELVGAPQC